MLSAEPLASPIADELARPAPPAAKLLGDAILDRFGPAVSAVLFYGSCLRKSTHEGVLDFYVIVDDYRTTYDSVYLRWANALVPPNVFFLERDSELGPVRCKYAVISRADFAHGVSPASRVPYYWARFAQPALIVHARDEDARRFVVDCCAQSIVTLFRRLGPFLPAQGDVQRFSPAALWQEAFRRTYGAELRTETEETVRSNYEAAPERYDAVVGPGLEMLREQGWLTEVAARGPSFEVTLDSARRRRARLRWHLERPLGKLLAFARLVKNATTFGDWVPYVLWKLERHTGRPIEASERQRRYPFLFGWPVLFRLIWRRDIF